MEGRAGKSLEDHRPNNKGLFLKREGEDRHLSLSFHLHMYTGAHAWMLTHTHAPLHIQGERKCYVHTQWSFIQTQRTALCYLQEDGWTWRLSYKENKSVSGGKQCCFRSYMHFLLYKCLCYTNMHLTWKETRGWGRRGIAGGQRGRQWRTKRLNLVKYMMSLNESIIRKSITLCNESVPLFFFFKTLWLSQRLQSVIFPSPIWIQGL